MRHSLKNRVRLQRDFDYIKKNAVKADCSAFILYMAPPREPRDFPRLGVVASKRIGNAVVRHRAKRIFREIFRSRHPSVPCDVLVFVRRGFSKFDFSALVKKFEGGCERLAKQLEQKRGESGLPQAELPETE